MLTMNRKLQVVCGVALLVAVVSAVVGCDDAAKRPVQARVPTTVPGPQTVKAGTSVPGPVQLPPLPLTAATHPLLLLKPQIAGDKDSLIAQVEQKFASGQQNYKAGHLEAARKDFDEAMDLMLESGYDPYADPKLSEVFHRVVDTVYTYELQAFRAGDGFQEAPRYRLPLMKWRR